MKKKLLNQFKRDYEYAMKNPFPNGKGCNRCVTIYYHPLLGCSKCGKYAEIYSDKNIQYWK